jgi:hypothetical protein
MRTWCFIVLLVLSACSRKPVADVPAEVEMVTTKHRPERDFVSPDAPQPIGRTIDPVYTANALLVVWWTTMGYWRDSADVYGFSLALDSDGYLTHLQETAMRRELEFRRYYPNEEAEKLFDSIIPAIEKHAIKTANPPRNSYFVRFAYQTKDGALLHDCVIPDLEALTALLAELEAGGSPEVPGWHLPVQPWARKRFDAFLPPRSPLEADPAEALKVKTEFNRP